MIENRLSFMPTTIGYPKANLTAQCPQIISSVIGAIEDFELKLLSLILSFSFTGGEPEELRHYAVSKIKSPMKHPAYLKWRMDLGDPTLQETIQAIIARNETDSVFRANAEKAFKIDEHGPFSLSSMMTGTKWKKAASS